MQVSNLPQALLSLRLGVFIVMFMWTIDKFINPDHSARVFEKYYLVSGLSSSLAYLLGVLQLILVLGFLLGIKKRLTYGAILIMHFVSTVSSYQMYMDPWGPKNLLFFAAWPMLAAIYSLYILREEDRLLTADSLIKK